MMVMIWKRMLMMNDEYDEDDDNDDGYDGMGNDNLGI